jgi:hypothetical protein
MNICTCGNLAEENSDRCARCAAFDALELKPDATTDAIHGAFEVLSKAWNPNRYQNDPKMKAIAEERLTAIDAAHTLLVRGSVQAAPFRSAATGARVEAPIENAFDEQTAKAGRGSREKGAGQSPGKSLRIPFPLLAGCGVVAGGIVVATLLFKPLDSVLMRVPVAGTIYAELKGEFSSRVQELKNKAGVGVGSPVPAPADATTGPSPDEQTQEGLRPGQVAERTPPQPGVKSHAAAQAPLEHIVVNGQAMPFITAGLTRDEVIAAQGAPTAETADEMDYGNSKLYFDKGVVYGWRIDPSSPLRVKLWPNGVVDPNLQAFGMDSTKNDVLVVEGTPTTFSPSTWAYGRSEVYFQYGRVVGWKNDIATPLRTTSR